MLAGTGKTAAILRCLGSYPLQVIRHASFPQLVGGHDQVVWLSVDVPASGRGTDLAASLMMEFDRVTGGTRFQSALLRQRRDGMRMLDEWRQVASSHFLGILHLDEVQNFFKMSALKQRSRRAGSPHAHELSIVEDQALRWVLTLMNTWQIPVLISGTPDGIHALTRRMSNLGRIVTSGYHPFHPFDISSDAAFNDLFLKPLGRYQYVAKKITIDSELAELILELTAGVRRFIIALWIAAHRVALERSTGDLRLDDFRRAAATYLAPIAPAVAALRSNDPVKMARYEDLLPRDGQFWAQFWSGSPADR